MIDAVAVILRSMGFLPRQGVLFDGNLNGARNDLQIPKNIKFDSALGPDTETETAATAVTAVKTKGIDDETPVAKPRVLIIHCGGTFGMKMSEEGKLQADDGSMRLLETCPEITTLASIKVHTAMNLDSSSMTPSHWIHIAQLVHEARANFAGFVIIHGTDTMVYTGSALSFMLKGLGKPVIFTGAQIPLHAGRTDARQNLVDAVMVASSNIIQEVAICFGGVVLRANRTTKMKSCAYTAFESPNYPPLATLGARVEWNHDALLRSTTQSPTNTSSMTMTMAMMDEIRNTNNVKKLMDVTGTGYHPRMRLNPHVVRLPVVPGVSPETAFGDLGGRGVRGAVLEAFGVGNLPSDTGWTSWLAHQRTEGVAFYVGTQCPKGPLGLNLYSTGASDLLGTSSHSSSRMTAESSVVKMMLCLEYPHLDMHSPIAGEL